MARSKSTARAEARRRYRAVQQAAEAAADEADPQAAGADHGTSGLRPPGGLRSLFAGRHFDWRGDIAAFPDLLRTQRSLWLAIGAIVFGTIVCIGLPLSTGELGITTIILQLLLFVPSIPLLLAGYFAPRAAWLEGFLLGILSLIGFLLVNFLALEKFSTATSVAATPSSILITAASLIVQWVLFGALFGVLASWYRTWLRKNNDNARKSREDRERRKRQEAKAKAQAH
ncbi:MAG TPA: hypothetical protein VFW92_02415 [Candidatus Limnocylindrales bacterium]|nr:hypothetical protein [Candidatus Limnocylindrales bacterium]